MSDTIRTITALQALLADSAAAHSTNRQLLRDMLVSLAPVAGPQAGGSFSIPGNANGALAVGGDFYNHVMIAVGYNGNPLTNLHEVGVWVALQSNAYVTGANSFLAAFESGISVAAGAAVVERVCAFAVGSLPVGSGSSVTRTYGIKLIDESVGVNNAAISHEEDNAFTGNWFIHYIGARASYLGGSLQVVGTLIGEEVTGKIATGFLRHSGGTLASPGANLILFGPTHASAANKMQLNASAGIAVTGAFATSAAFGCNGATAQTALASGGAAPAGGTGATAGAYDTAAHRDAAITLLNNIRTALVNNGIMS
jgi:hypothetical protein